MAYKKTCWYTVIAPLRIGVICGSRAGPAAPLDEELPPLIELGFLAGIAFQIHDDLLNLEADEALYGKEIERRPVGGQAHGDAPALPAHRARPQRASARCACCGAARARRRADEVALAAAQAMIDAGSLEHGRRARGRVLRARARDWTTGALPVSAADGDDSRFLREMLRYVIDRVK